MASNASFAPVRICVSTDSILQFGNDARMTRQIHNGMREYFLCKWGWQVDFDYMEGRSVLRGWQIPRVCCTDKSYDMVIVLLANNHLVKKAQVLSETAWVIE